MNDKEQDILEYVGDIDQLITLREGTLRGGFQEGVRAAEISNGGNLSATLLPDRCIDIYQIRYKGKNLNYIAPCGTVGSQYYDARGSEWLRGFYVGFLTTCGLQHIGGPIIVNGEERGQHGRISYAPAEDLRFVRSNVDGVPALSVEGTMREARIFGENLRLHRKVEFVYENDSILLTDRIENCGYGERQFIYALHLNYGYPLLEEGTELIFDALETIPRDENAARHLNSFRQVDQPEYPYPERCYFHKLKQDDQGMTEYTIFNRKRGIGVNVTYDGNDLPYFCQWKMLGKGEYVMGLEPMNVFLDGPKIGEPGCSAPVLRPGESKEYRVAFRFLDRL